MAWNAVREDWSQICGANGQAGQLSLGVLCVVAARARSLRSLLRACLALERDSFSRVWHLSLVGWHSWGWVGHTFLHRASSFDCLGASLQHGLLRVAGALRAF